MTTPASPADHEATVVPGRRFAHLIDGPLHEGVEAAAIRAAEQLPGTDTVPEEIR